VIVGSTAEVDGPVIRHRTSVPRSTTTARPSAVTLVAGQQAGQRWWTLRTAIQLCSTGCWGCDQRRQPGTATITLLSAPPLCRCTSLTSDPIPARGYLCGNSRQALAMYKNTASPLSAPPWSGLPTVRRARITARRPADCALRVQRLGRHPAASTRLSCAGSGHMSDSPTRLGVAGDGSFRWLNWPGRSLHLAASRG